LCTSTGGGKSKTEHVGEVSDGESRHKGEGGLERERKGTEGDLINYRISKMG
jgi:hypothetical protein